MKSTRDVPEGFSGQTDEIFVMDDLGQVDRWLESLKIESTPAEEITNHSNKKTRKKCSPPITIPGREMGEDFEPFEDLQTQGAGLNGTESEAEFSGFSDDEEEKETEKNKISKNAKCKRQLFKKEENQVADQVPDRISPSARFFNDRLNKSSDDCESADLIGSPPFIKKYSSDECGYKTNERKYPK